MLFELKGKKICFVHIGGNAGTAIEHAIYRLLNDIELNTMIERRDGLATHINNIDDKKFLEFLKGNNFNNHAHLKHSEYVSHMRSIGINTDDIEFFTVIRNPYDRMVSKFFSSCPRAKRLSDIDEARVEFEKFVREMYSYKSSFSSNQKIHTDCQSVFFDDNVTVLRYEEINDSFPVYMKKFDVNIQLQKFNSTSHPLKSCDIYNDVTRDLVYEKNKTIIDRFYSLNQL